MMKWLLKIFFLWFWGMFDAATAQTDGFNSVSQSETKIGKFSIAFNYYPLNNNINNARSSVFFDSHPSAEQAMIAAINLPSDFVVIRDSHVVIAIIVLVNKPKREFLVIDPLKQSQYVLPCNLTGDICENRAIELFRHEFESKSYRKNLEYFIQGRRLKIIPIKSIENKMMEIIRSEKLLNQNSLIPNNAERKKALIINQSVENRSLDYFSKIKGIENVEIEIVPDVYETNLNFALYKWGRATKDLGIETVDFSLIIWQELVHRNPTKQEIEMIRSGFNKSWEK